MPFPLIIAEDSSSQGLFLFAFGCFLQFNKYILAISSSTETTAGLQLCMYWGGLVVKCVKFCFGRIMEKAFTDVYCKSPNLFWFSWVGRNILLNVKNAIKITALTQLDMIFLLKHKVSNISIILYCESIEVTHMCAHPVSQWLHLIYQDLSFVETETIPPVVTYAT